MGDISGDENIDTEIITDNGDMEKVLSTVALAAFSFLSQYTDCQIIIKGSKKARTRLYRMAINVNYDLLTIDFDIAGIFEEKEITGNFEKGSTKDYDAFLVKRNTVVR